MSAPPPPSAPSGAVSFTAKAAKYKWTQTMSFPPTESLETVFASIGAALSLPPANLKLLLKGKFLKREDTIASSGLTEGAKVLVMETKPTSPAPPSSSAIASGSTSTSSALPPAPQDPMSRARALGDTAELLAERAANSAAVVEDDKAYFELENQDGTVINLPPEDRKALIVGMALHEKGRKALNAITDDHESMTAPSSPQAAQGSSTDTASPSKADDVTAILVPLSPRTKAQGEDLKDCLAMLREADAAFSRASQSTLSLVDNYAMLNLDIVWVYFKLNDPSLFTDAAHRLDIVQKQFAKSHGANRERLLALRKGFSPETVLYVRLHLLQGVLAYATGQTGEASRKFASAATLAASVSISQDSMTQLMAMGFTEIEARRGLRAASGDIAGASTYIFAQRDKAAATAARDRTDAKTRREQARLGRTANGTSYVDLTMKDNLIAMSFPAPLVVEALRQTNNDQAASLSLLLENRVLLEAAIRTAAQSASAPASSSSNPVPAPSADNPGTWVTEHGLRELIRMGFDEKLAQAALMKSKGSLTPAVNSLLSGEIDAPTAEALLASASPEAIAAAADALKAARKRRKRKSAARTAGSSLTPATTTTATAGTPDAANGGANAHDGDAAFAAALAAADEELDEDDEDDDVMDEAALERERQAAMERDLMADLDDDDPEAYLDITLDDELEAISKYQTLLAAASTGAAVPSIPRPPSTSR